MTIYFEDVAEYTEHGFYVKDSDTSYELLCYELPFITKAGVKRIVRCMLRDPETKRFVKGVNVFGIRYVAVFEACYPGGCRKGKGCSPTNNLHVECQNFRRIEVRGYTSIRDLLIDIQILIDEMYDKCMDKCFDKYGVEPEDEDLFIHTEADYTPVCYADRCDPTMVIEERVID